MKIYTRNNILYDSSNGKRVSTKLKDTKENRKLITSYYKNDEFFKKFDVNKNVPSIVELCEEVLEESAQTVQDFRSKIASNLNQNEINQFFTILEKVLMALSEQK